MENETPVDEGFAATDPGFGADASPEPAPDPDKVDAEPGDDKVEESEGESPSPVEEDDEEKTDAFQKRIDKLTGSFRESEREGDALRLQLDEANRKLADVPEVVEPIKTLADFGYDDDRYRQYLFDETTSRAKKTAEDVVRQSREVERAETVADGFAAREKAFAKDNPDYFKVTRSRDLKVNEAMKAELQESDIGTDIALHLGLNPDEATRISRLPAREIIREMQTLETSIRAEKAKAPKKVSDAPKPPAKIKGKDPGTKVSTTDPKSDKMSDKEWFAAEDRRNAKLRG